MNAIKFLILLGFFLAFSAANYGQDLLPIIKTAKGFLGKNNPYIPYDIEVDSLGNIHFASRSGIRVSNGQKIINNSNRGEPDLMTWVAFFKDAKGRLWCNSLTGDLALMKDGKPVRHALLDSFRHLSSGILDNFYCDTADRLHLASRGNGYFIVHPSGEIEEIVGKESGLHGFVVTHLEDGTPFHFSIFQQSSELLSLSYLQSNGKIHPIAEHALEKGFHESTLIEHKDGSMTLAPGSKSIIRFNKDELLSNKIFPVKIIKLFEDSRETLWIGTLNGIYKVLDENLEEMVHVLEGSPAAVVAEDLEGGLWLKSDSIAFGYIAYPDALLFPFGENNNGKASISCVATDNQRVFAALGNRRIAVISGDDISYLSVPKVKEASLLPANHLRILHFDTHTQVLWVAYKRHLAKWDGKKWEFIFSNDIRFLERGIGDIITDSNGTLYGVAGNRFFMVTESNEFIFSRFFREFQRSVKIGLDTSGTIWLATYRGLWKYEDDSLSQPSVIPDSMKDKIVRELAIVNGKVYLGIDGHGMFVINKDTLTPVLGNQKKRLRSDNWFIDKFGDLWAFEYGEWGVIDHIKVHDDTIVVKQYYEFKAGIGLALTENSLVVKKGEIFLGTPKGLLKQDLNKLKLFPILSNPIFRYFRANHLDQPLSSNYWLEPDQNTISVGFDLISMEMMPIAYSTRMIGLDSVWRESEHNEIVYNNLDPGSYVFQVRAKTTREDWGIMKEIHFNIATPYYETWWFRSLGVLVLMGIGAGLWGFQARTQKKRAKLEIEKLKAEQTALKAQMNPHFMFNALGSIQDLVYNHSKLLALKNIALFSRLMRQILDHSSEELISLEEEIEILTNYLKLEALRFEGDFNFTFQVAPNVNLHKCQVPPLLLQPFAENAVKHGLLNKIPKGGTISIQFEMEVKNLICVVEDDGIGREEAGKIQTHHQSEHRSFATNAVYKRIEVLNIQNKTKIALNILDIFDENAKAAGTRVTLVIPQTHQL